jgi:hypothetical protein
MNDRHKENVMAKNNRIFICFAIEDAVYRDFLRGQAKNNKTPFVFDDMSVKEPWDSEWKTKCRAKIKGCDGVIVLITSNTYNADGARWEMKCANEEGIPMIGVYVDKNTRPAIPSELSGKKIIEWTWDGIAAFVNSL